MGYFTVLETLSPFQNWGMKWNDPDISDYKSEMKFQFMKTPFKSEHVVYACNYNVQDAVAGGLSWIPGQPGRHRKTLSQSKHIKPKACSLTVKIGIFSAYTLRFVVESL